MAAQRSRLARYNAGGNFRAITARQRSREIVNASEMAQKDTVLRLERNSAGELTRAVAHKI
jgi:hypothetical protein